MIRWSPSGKSSTRSGLTTSHASWIARQRMFYIVTELERRGNAEIALLPMIESAFNPVAHSIGQSCRYLAVHPVNGRELMKQDWWADSRRDIVAATNGALDYLESSCMACSVTGNWRWPRATGAKAPLARAVQRSEGRGRDGTYLSLDMPVERVTTCRSCQAVKNIIRNPAAYGVTIAIPNEPYFQDHHPRASIDLKRAAQLAEMTETDFVALNQAHNRRSSVGEAEYQVLLPARTDGFLSRL